jgi:hypothetical protein
MIIVEFVEVKIAQIVVGNLLGKHVIDGHQDLMGDGHGSALVPATGLETIKLVPQPEVSSPRRFRSRLATIRKLSAISAYVSAEFIGYLSTAQIFFLSSVSR